MPLQAHLHLAEDRFRNHQIDSDSLQIAYVFMFETNQGPFSQFPSFYLKFCLTAGQHDL